MDFMQWLKHEHETVRQLLQKIPDADEAAREDLFEQVKMELQVHHQLEEKYLYPLGEGFGPTKQLAQHAIDETRKAEQMMSEMDPSDAEFEEQIREFTQMIEDHVEEEENELVPQLMKDVPREQQDKLVRILEEAKKQAIASAE